MKKTIKGFLLGVIITVFLMTTVFATGNATINGVLNGINIFVNGEQVAKVGDTYTLSNGEKIPFSILYNGTTYLPMRKVGELVNKDIEYIGSTKTASINDKLGSDLLPPVTIDGALIQNTDGTTNYDFDIYNVGTKDIKSIEFIIYSYDKNGLPIIDAVSKTNHTFIVYDKLLKVGTFEANLTVELMLNKPTDTYGIEVTNVVFSNGETWPFYTE